ncbi:MAG: hypothetical protein ACOYMG_21545 [Candidatus Methylumidiphilus sp.]
MNYAFHPEAAMEYAEQVAHYNSLREAIAKRYHHAVKAAALKACAAPIVTVSTFRQLFAKFR